MSEQPNKSKKIESVDMEDSGLGDCRTYEEISNMQENSLEYDFYQDFSGQLRRRESFNKQISFYQMLQEKEKLKNMHQSSSGYKRKHDDEEGGEVQERPPKRRRSSKDENMSE